jgi:CRP/FNR family transcriptional regulator, cyclic AMP receptor protein
VKDFAEQLAAHPFFSDLPPRLINTIAAHATWMERPAGAWIAHVGGEADKFYAVISGRIGIEIAAADKEPLLVSTVHPGEVVGWSWFTDDRHWQFDVVALDDVRAIAIDASGVRAACEADPALNNQLARRLLRVVAARLAATRHQLTDVYGRAR